MARIRSVHPDICVSASMAELPANLERTFVRLWTHCDDEGRCIDEPRLIKAALYPLHDDITADMLDDELNELAEAGKVIRYVAEGKRVLTVRPDSWCEYQKPQRPTRSKLPGLPDSSASPHGDAKEGTTSDRGRLIAGEGEGEGVGGGEGDAPGASSPAEVYPPEFERFWSSYPRKTEKRKALKAWRARTREGTDADVLIRAAGVYGGAMVTTEPRFIKHPATFLGPERPFEEWLTGPTPVNGVTYDDKVEYR